MYIHCGFTLERCHFFPNFFKIKMKMIKISETKQKFGKKHKRSSVIHEATLALFSELFQNENENDKTFLYKTKVRKNVQAFKRSSVNLYLI
jgi:hypothetical protein